MIVSYRKGCVWMGEPRFQIDHEFVVSQEKTYFGNQSDIYQVEDRFTILLGGQKFFEEPHFPLLEFALHFKKWDREGRKGDFNFCSLDYDDYIPIIRLLRKGNLWHFRSIWEEFDSSHLLFFVDEIFPVLEAFVKRVDQELYDVCGYEIDYYYEIEFRKYFPMKRSFKKWLFEKLSFSDSK